MCIQPFIVEAETLYLLKIDPGLLRSHIERRMSDDCLIGEVFGREEDELVFAETDSDLALQRLETPRQVRCDAGVEAHRDDPIGQRGVIAFRPLRRTGKPGRGAKQSIECRRIRDQRPHDANQDDERARDLQVLAPSRIHGRRTVFHGLQTPGCAIILSNLSAI